MLKTKDRCLLTFKSVHHRLTAEQVLKDYQIQVELVPVPPEIRTNCDKALKMDCQHQSIVVEILKCQQVGIEKVIRVTNEKERLLERFRNSRKN